MANDQQTYKGRVSESFRTVSGEWLSASQLLALISEGIRPTVDNITVFATTESQDGVVVADDKDALREAAAVLQQYAENFGWKISRELVRQGIREKAERTNRSTGETFTSPRAVYISLPMSSGEHVRSALLGALAQPAKQAPSAPRPASAGVGDLDLPF